LLLSSLFIVLAARIDLDNFYAMGWPGIAFFATLVVVVRPAAVLASTVGMSLAWKEKLFLMWMAPRGVVAAAVTSVFALRMLDMGYEGANVLVPTVFTVIAGTVALYGLTAGLLARVLKLADPSPQGVVIIGAHALAREIAQVLKKENQKTLLVDSNWKQVTEARQKGLKAYYGDVMSEHIFDKVDFSGMGRMIAMTSNDEINALAALHFRDLFGRNEVYQLVPPQAGAGVQNRTSAPRHLRGRTLFGPKITFSHLYDRVEHGAQVKATQLTEEYAFAKFRQQHSTAIPLFTITESGNLHVVTEEGSRQPRPGDRLIFLYQEEKETSVQSQPPASDTEKPALP
ncbi:MAG: NAD-binding protein, partial [Candidatus Hydrogenedentes bacterium]|nr:NAD-binding protein [Candidatus Hydrogenedentota bacterium]